MKLPEVADEVVSSCEVDQWSGYDVVSEGSSIIVHNPLSYGETCSQSLDLRPDGVQERVFLVHPPP